MKKEVKTKCYFRVDENINGEPVLGRYPVVKAEQYGDYVVHTSPGQTKIAPSSQMSCVKKRNSGNLIKGFAPTAYEAWEKYEATTDKQWEHLRKTLSHIGANRDKARHKMHQLKPTFLDGVGRNV